MMNRRNFLIKSALTLGGLVLPQETRASSFTGLNISDPFNNEQALVRKIRQEVKSYFPNIDHRKDCLLNGDFFYVHIGPNHTILVKNYPNYCLALSDLTSEGKLDRIVYADGKVNLVDIKKIIKFDCLMEPLAVDELLEANESAKMSGERPYTRRQLCELDYQKNHLLHLNFYDGKQNITTNSVDFERAGKEMQDYYRQELERVLNTLTDY